MPLIICPGEGEGGPLPFGESRWLSLERSTDCGVGSCSKIEGSASCCTDGLAGAGAKSDEDLASGVCGSGPRARGEPGPRIAEADTAEVCGIAGAGRLE